MKKKHQTPAAQYRQGDVFIEAIGDIPTTAAATEAAAVPREDGRIVLAHGEATGHAHAIRSKAATLTAVGDRRYLKVAGVGKAKAAGVSLDHEEHDTIMIPPGNYRVVRQKEYSPQEIRNVAD